MIPCKVYTRHQIWLLCTWSCSVSIPVCPVTETTSLPQTQRSQCGGSGPGVCSSCQASAWGTPACLSHPVSEHFHWVFHPLWPETVDLSRSSLKDKGNSFRGVKQLHLIVVDDSAPPRCCTVIWWDSISLHLWELLCTALLAFCCIPTFYSINKAFKNDKSFWVYQGYSCSLQRWFLQPIGPHWRRSSSERRRLHRGSRDAGSRCQDPCRTCRSLPGSSWEADLRNNEFPGLWKILKFANKRIKSIYLI